MREFLSLCSLFSSHVQLSHFISDAFAEAALDLLEPGVKAKAQSELKKCRELGIDIIDPSHLYYPRRFFLLEKPPLCVLCVGESSLLVEATYSQEAGILAVVGSRHPTNTAKQWMHQSLAPYLQKRRPVLISGGARGIDQEAERIATITGCKILIVLPSGFQWSYPRGFNYINSRRQGVCWLTTRPYSTKPLKGYFESRNRLIVRLADMVLIPEARRRSGSTMTGRLAFEIGVPLVVVPNSPLVAKGLGCLDLLESGAGLVRDQLDLLVKQNDACVASRQLLVPNPFHTPEPNSEENQIGEPHGRGGGENFVLS